MIWPVWMILRVTIGVGKDQIDDALRSFDRAISLAYSAQGMGGHARPAHEGRVFCFPQGVPSKPEDFDPKADSDDWVKWNQERDKQINF